MLTIGATSNGKVTIPVDGLYHVSFFCYSTTIDSAQGERAFLYLFKNGVEEIGQWDSFEANAASDGAAAVGLKAYALREYKAGDVIQVQLFHSFGAAYTFTGIGSVCRVDGPIQPLANETVYEAWESSAGTSYANAANLIYGTKVKSTHGSYNSSTGEFIANKAGDLEIDGLFGSLNTNTATEIYIYCRKNGADYRMLSDIQRTPNNRGVIKFYGKFPVNQNDSIFIRVSHDGTSMATAAFAFYNYVNFTLK